MVCKTVGWSRGREGARAVVHRAEKPTPTGRRTVGCPAVWAGARSGSACAESTTTLTTTMTITGNRGHTAGTFHAGTFSANRATAPPEKRKAGTLEAPHCRGPAGQAARLGTATRGA